MGKPKSAPITLWRKTGRSSPWCRRTGGRGMRVPGTGRGSATSTAGRSVWNWSTLGMNGAIGPFPHAQMAAFAALARGIMDRHGILPHRVLAHSDVAPSRKEDPGELFDWRGLAAQGVGFWPTPGAQDDGPGHAVAEAQALLARFGYESSRTEYSIRRPELPRRRSSGTSFPIGLGMDSIRFHAGAAGRR